MQQSRDENANAVGANRIVLEGITREQNVPSNALVNLAIYLKEHAHSLQLEHSSALRARPLTC